MSERSISQVRSNSTRTSDGKRLDTWRVDFPDGPGEVIISMHSSKDDIYFSAKSSHPALRGLAWEGTDLAQMRATIKEDVERAARSYYETDWKPAVCVETSIYNSDRGSSLDFHVAMKVVDMHVDPTKPIGNQGETAALSGGVQTTILQRSHDQNFECDGSLNSKNMLYSKERGKAASRVIVDAEDRERIMELRGALEAFSIKLMRRLSPDTVRFDGIPTPEDLALVMRDALDNPEKEDRDENEFRM